MAVTRPLKEGSVTTYQAKVAAGFPDILASEMDADLDTIYGAWNGTLGGDLTGTLPNPTLTAAAKSKWAAGATLTPVGAFANLLTLDATGQLLIPTTGFAGSALQWGQQTAKAHLLYSAAVGSQGGYWTHNRVLNSGATAWLTDDATVPSWQLSLPDSANQFSVNRAPAGSPNSGVNLLTLDPTGILTVPGAPSGGPSQPGTILVGGTRSGKLRVWSSPNGDYAALFHNLSLNSTASAWVQDDTAKPSWVLHLGNSDLALIARAAPAGQPVNLLLLDAPGNLTITGATATKASGTTWANPSDIRLKRDVTPYARGLADILALDPITYRLKAAPERECYGFDAAKVRDVFPECVAEVRMKLDPDDEEETEGVLSFDMHPILVALVNAVKELAAR